MRGRKLVAAVLFLVVLVGAGVAWTERGSLRAWYYLRGLGKAGEADRDAWIERVASLGEPAVEGLLECLARQDGLASRNAAAALDHLARTWGCDHARTVDLVAREGRLFAHVGPEAQADLLRGMAGWFGQATPADGLVPACARLLSDARSSADADTQLAALELAAILVRQPQGCEALRPARDLARAGLEAKAAANRLRAVQLSLHPGMDLLESVVGLMHDPVVEVRRAVLVAVGPADQVVRDEGLLPSLHDPDPEVRRLTEAALRGRGLRPEHLELGRLLTHPDHHMRVRVLDHLREAPDLDPGLWLRRLSHDRKPSVRAAALRVMSGLTVIDLSDRIDQMANSDPNPSVAQMARFYLSQKRSVSPVER
jgi:hypothetical protein